MQTYSTTQQLNYLHDAFNLNDPDVVSILDDVPLWSAPFGLKLLDYIPYEPGLSVLDIGCGTGFPLIELAMRLGNDAKVYGIDIWSTALDRIRKKVEILGLSNIELLSGSAEKINLPDKSIDLIVSNNGINNVDNLTRVLKECHRIAKPDARFIATVNLEDTMLPFYTCLKKVFEKLGMEEQIALTDKHIHHKRKPLIYLSEQMKCAGFQISQLIKDEFFYRFATGSAFLNHYFIKLAFLPSWKEIVPEGMLTTVFSMVESELNEIAALESGLSLIIPYVLIEARAE